MRRRTRIVCISDTHNCQVKLPKGDVLIHAGDLTNQGNHAEVCSSDSQMFLTATYEAEADTSSAFKNSRLVREAGLRGQNCHRWYGFSRLDDCREVSNLPFKLQATMISL